MPLCIHNKFPYMLIYSHVQHDDSNVSVVNIDCAHLDGKKLNGSEHAFSSLILCVVFECTWIFLTLQPHLHTREKCNFFNTIHIRTCYRFCIYDGPFPDHFGILFRKAYLIFIPSSLWLNMAFIYVALILNLYMLNDSMNKILIFSVLFPW